MRPDAAAWQSTTGMAAIEFSPRHLVSRKVVGWIVRIVIFQAVWCIATWICLDTLGAFGSRDAAAPSPSLAGLDIHTLEALLIAQISGALVVALLILKRIMPPLRTHTTALQELLNAIRRMASGASPQPLAVGSPCEATYLSLAFNDMASKLLASRRALIDANQMLERRVEERTKELREAAEQMQAMAKTDVLTRLANRRALQNEVKFEFDLAKQHDGDLAFLLIDLDGFKLVNDTLGHKTGDEVICLTADILRKEARASDIPVRLGGDEFLLAMPAADIGQAVAVGDRLRAEFQRRSAELLSDHMLPRMPSMSIGVSSRKQANPTTVEELLAQADQALYDAKETGKARTVVFERRAA